MNIFVILTKNTPMNNLFYILKKFFTVEEKEEHITRENLKETSVTAVFPSIAENLNYIQNIYTTPLNSDIKIRKFKTGGKDAFIVFVEGLVNSDFINSHILAPLMLLAKNPDLSQIKNTLIVHNQLKTQNNFENILSSVNLGDCALFVDGIPCAFTADIKSYTKRGIQPPVSESVIYGPHEGFNENFKINTSLIRKIVRDENLICETLTAGKISKTPLAFMYMKNIANDSAVKELKRRIDNIEADYIYQAGELEQFIEDSPFSLVPQFLTTERPDKSANELIEGKIVLILQGSPFALIAPVTAGDFITTVEDNYIRFPFANLIKVIRIIGIIMSFLLSGLYIATINFHKEMIPTNLLFAIASSRQNVPFAPFFELIIMEIAFDIIREASIRVPSPIGSTLGIIGGLIIGQAAVEANLVSPIAIIIVSVVGIGSFATPNYGLNMGLRFLRYIFLISGAVAGFFGISAGLVIFAFILTDTKSLGTSLLTGASSDSEDNFLSLFFKKPIYKRESRHAFIHPKIKRMQNHISRKWTERN